ncbi:MAG: hypothetical protein F6K58_28625 [Symploca sp. SIO2E9]|nr:hypothetical protein [Symploca sp. SIO2E9]
MRIHSSIILLSLLTISLVHVHAHQTTAHGHRMQLNSVNEAQVLLVATEPCPEDNNQSPNRGCPRYLETSQSTQVLTPEIYHRGSGRISPIEIG